MNPAELLTKNLRLSIAAKQNFLDRPDQIEAFARAVDVVVNAYRHGGRLYLAGNGGSAADAQHFAAELIGRFEQERSAWPAIALTTDTSILTAIGNDYGFDQVFARQVQGLGAAGDILLGISTSGHSKNVMGAVQAAKSQGMTTIGLLGRDGGLLKTGMDQAVVVPVSNTARIQEAHSFILHYWAMLLEQRLAGAAI